MPTYHYEAMDASGGEISSTLQAADQKAANTELRARGYFVTRLREVCPHCGAAVRKAADRCEDCGQWLTEREEGAELGHRPEPRRRTDAAADEALNAKLLDLLQAGRKLEAIKVHREATRSSLAESKAYVDLLIRRHGLPDAGRGGCLPVLALLLTTAAAAMTTGWLAGGIDVVNGGWAGQARLREDDWFCAGNVTRTLEWRGADHGRFQSAQNGLSLVSVRRISGSGRLAVAGRGLGQCRAAHPRRDSVLGRTRGD